ncbi:cytochrome c oxidase, cbb3-type, subunit I [Leptospira weilii str. 2006001853]|uniref:cytochrome-c oxidase n=3 Tax=Leptospira weilii TaxID=28184 RepID=A0A828YZN6_9LEPT|nr:cytochrome-c oxidase, cbb3-type subunit I [Leptospira weilii]EKR62879.1 cytochrome c oxidase, cbb3-type, subunit I [Leptospira weilii str. 2006001853]EMN43624.1 cytochrome c oxidase, cbb3-type, subunit I [Leptospira weilii str. LNT 1234]MDL5244779.1 cytochrome-c oxidase, cbb3-type subunit I [Leptospira weilii]UPY77773.1 cytochrome-c oxidase, cbb3-type subunit I [Leptospira weilii]
MGQTSTKYNDSIVKGFIVSALVWGVASMLVGVLAAFQMVYPELNFTRYFTFGRIRPLHTNAAIFGFALSVIFATAYHLIQRLCRVRIWNDSLAKIHFVLYNLTIVLAAITLPLGLNQSKEYAELEWPLDLLIVVWFVIFLVNFLATIFTREEKQLYAAIWFYIASFVTIPILFIVNNLSVPVSLSKSYSIFSGVYDANIQWWYGHNAVAFVLTTPFLGLMYYYFPKHIKQPIYSHRLSIIHFWSLIFIYIWAGPHHLLNTPLPEWLQTTGMAFSIMLWMPSWGGMLNGFLTLTQAKEKIKTDAILKMMLVGITFYGMSTFEGPLLSIRSISALGHNTDWIIGHVHSGTLGWVGMMSFAAIYYLVPRMWNANLYSEKLANVHFWFATLGILLYIVSMWVSGITEGSMWRAIDSKGFLQYPTWVQITEVLNPFRFARAVAGAIYLSGVFVMLYNVFKTIQSSGSGFQEVDLRVKEEGESA